MSETRTAPLLERERARMQERPTTARTHPDEVELLIDAARRHPLGIEFLLDGDLGAVAIIFRVHAFTVEAARLVCRGHSFQPKGACDGLS